MFTRGLPRKTPAMPKLTPASVEKHKPNKHRRREISDAASPGLYLVVQPSGTKSFAMRYRNANGRHVKLTLGRLDLTGQEAADAPVIGQPLTLVSARRLASEVHRQRALGKDTVAARHRERLERKAGGARTFSQAALDFTEQYLKREVRRWQASARLLGIVVDDDGKLAMTPKGLTDRWRDRPITDINGDDIHLIVDEVREKAVPGLKRRAGGPSEAMARAMYSCLSRMFGWLVEKRRVQASPVIGVTMPKTAKSRDRVLTDDELKKFWAACARAGQPGTAMPEIAFADRLPVERNRQAAPRRNQRQGQDRHASRQPHQEQAPARGAADAAGA